MKVFLSWSGKRSKAMAELLSDWLEQVIQAVEPWISTDIEKGRRWSREISNKLEESRVGIICLTRENPDENWILFEAGAISKTKDARVCTFLLDLKSSDIEPPLGEFQHTKFEKEDVRKLLHTINEAVKNKGERALGENQLNKIFKRFWPDLEDGLNKILEQGPETEKPTRPPEEMLEEILERIRTMERRQQEQESRGAYYTPGPSGSQPLHMFGTFIPPQPGEKLLGGSGRNALVYYLDRPKQEEEEKREDLPYHKFLKNEGKKGGKEKKRKSITPKKKPK